MMALVRAVAEEITMARGALRTAKLAGRAAQREAQARQGEVDPKAKAAAAKLRRLRAARGAVAASAACDLCTSKPAADSQESPIAEINVRAARALRRTAIRPGRRAEPPARAETS